MWDRTAGIGGTGNPFVCQNVRKWLFTTFQNVLLRNKERELCGKLGGATPTCRHLTPHPLALHRGGGTQHRIMGYPFLFGLKAERTWVTENHWAWSHKSGSGVAPSPPATRMNEQQGSSWFKDLEGKYWWIKNIRKLESLWQSKSHQPPKYNQIYV